MEPLDLMDDRDRDAIDTAAAVIPYASKGMHRDRATPAPTQAALVALTALLLLTGVPMGVGGMWMFFWTLHYGGSVPWLVFLPAVVMGTISTRAGVWCLLRSPAGWRRVLASQVVLAALDLYFVALGLYAIRHGGIGIGQTAEITALIGGTTLLISRIWATCYLPQPAPRRAFGYSPADTEGAPQWPGLLALVLIAAYGLLIVITET